MTSNNIESLILEASRKGDIANVIVNLYMDDNLESEALIEVVAMLHNDGLIDLISVSIDIDKELFGFKYYRYIGFVEKCLFKIDIKVFDLLELVKCVIKNDGYNRLSSVVDSYLLSNQEVISEILSFALDTPKEYKEILFNVLSVGLKTSFEEYFHITEGIILEGNADNSMMASRCIGRFNFPSHYSPLSYAFDMIIKNVSFRENKDVVLSSIDPLFELYFKDAGLESKLIEFIHDYISDATMCFEIIRIVYLNSNSMSSSVLTAAFDKTLNLQQWDDSLKSMIDNALSLLVLGNQEDFVQHFLSSALSNVEGVNVDCFEGFIRSISKTSNNFLDRVVTQWLLSSNIKLRSSAGLLIFNLNISKSREVKFHMASVGGIDYLYLAKIACGWLYNNQVSLTSFLVSLLECSEGDSFNRIKAILYYPLLVSYPCEVKKCLDEAKGEASPKVVGAIEECISELNRIQGTGTLERRGEFLLPQSQVEIRNQYNIKKSREMHKEIYRNSFMSKIATPSVILYGRGSLYYMHGDREDSRQENHFTSIERSFELSFLNAIDPHGLELLLYQYRVEGVL